MVIRSANDVEKLLRDRIEAMEDLDCLDLEGCVMNFMYLHTAVKLMEMTKDNATDETDPIQKRLLRETFDTLVTVAEQSMDMIDRLTLRTEAAE